MTTLLSFLFVLGVLVFVHELGHFLVARWYGVRVITFSLGFGPKIAKVVRGGTEYCISAIPLGGYVKLAGETVEDNREGAPDVFLSKSKWVRFQVYLAGPVMTVLLAIVVLAGVLSQGADVPLYQDAPAVIGSVAEGSPADLAGVQVGDRVLSVDGRTIETWNDFDYEVLTRGGREMTLFIDRGGQQVTINLTADAVGRYEGGDIGVDAVKRPQIIQVNPGAPAEAAGLQADDVILEIGGEAGLSQPEVIERIQASPNQPLGLVVERGGAPVTLTVTPEEVDGVGRIGA